MKHRFIKYTFINRCRVFLLLLPLCISSWSQITLDGTLGGPAGPLDGPNFAITDDLGRLSGSNLFHSFTEFNLNSGEAAIFSNASPNSVQNILSRVTGGNPSSIDGTIRSTVDGANLFFLNPNGVLFGPDATLEISGSFSVSTGDHIAFTDGAQFNANINIDSDFSTASPVAFGFLGDSPGSISVKGELELIRNSSIDLAATDITIDGGRLETANGGVELRAANSVQIINGGVIASESRGAGGAVRIESPEVTIDGRNSIGFTGISVQKRGSSERGAGGRLNINSPEGLNILNGGALSVDSFGSSDSGSVTVKTGSVLIDGQTSFQPTGISANAFGGGDAGTIDLVSESVTLQNNARIQASTSTPTINTGNAGEIRITTPVDAGVGLVVEDTSRISANAAFGNGGQITVVTSEIIGEQNITAFSQSGRPGDKTINTSELDLSASLPGLVIALEEQAAISEEDVQWLPSEYAGYARVGWNAKSRASNRRQIVSEAEELPEGRLSIFPLRSKSNPQNVTSTLDGATGNTRVGWGARSGTEK